MTRGDPAPDAETPSDRRLRRAGPIGVLCLSGFGLGLSPIMPGTVASLGTAALILAGSSHLIAFLGLVIVCIVFGSWATLTFGDRLADASAKKAGDPGWVVSDEVAGQAIASLGTLPAFGDWRLALVAFVLFRVFDMVKVGPVKRAEQMPGAVGVLLDDLVAGAFAGMLTLAVGLADVLP